MSITKDALAILQETSRTFYIPIAKLPPRLQEAVASAYLLMRAIDEIEDHAELDSYTKVQLLRQISLNLQAGVEGFGFEDFSHPWNTHPLLPEVSVRLGDWALLAPTDIAPRIWDATAAMADRMAHWAQINWQVNTEADLNRYTWSVAGAVGLLLSDLWAWYDGTQTNRAQAIGFGRGLQSVNILRNHQEDLRRGVDFFPDGWHSRDMEKYARRNLALADAYTHSLPQGAALGFCRIPLALAHATLDVMANGEEKLSRSQVVKLIAQVTSNT